jgi:hypothetical protein
MKASLVVMMIVPGNCANFVHPKPTELTQQNHEQLDTLLQLTMMMVTLIKPIHFGHRTQFAFFPFIHIIAVPVAAEAV